MRTNLRYALLTAIIVQAIPMQGAWSAEPAGEFKEISRDALLDRIHGGWVGMLIGGLEGLPHEFKYNDKPRETLPDFKYLPNGATTDDDNDFEWVHLFYMDRERTLKLPYPRIVEIWKANMNTGIWVANKRARELMDEGVVPPETSNPARNKHSTYNLSGQFAVESYGMIAPGMPKTATEIGVHYAQIAVQGEPLQATRYWTSLISLVAFDERPLSEVIITAKGAIDPQSAMAQVVEDALKAWRQNPQDWKAARLYFHQTWLKEKKWNNNSTPLNGAMVLLALLYGDGDFYKTLQYAMALGYDCDCNAATAGAVVGYRLGFKRISQLPGFAMPDRFINKTRPALPNEVKISEQAEMMTRIAAHAIQSTGGQCFEKDGRPVYRIKLQRIGE